MFIIMSHATVLSPSPVSAATQFTSDYFGIGFDQHEADKMEKADGWSNGGMFDCTWTASNVNFSNGIMNLSINRNYSGYTGGEFRTLQTFGYGMYDVSMKPIKNDGVGNHEYIYDLGFDASKEFHQYGFYWDKGTITWYVDKVPVYTATNNIPSTPGHIMMNVWPGKGVDEWLNPFNGVTPLTGQYDWMSYTKPGASSGVSFDSSKLYVIKSKNSGKVLDVEGGSTSSGGNVLQWDITGKTISFGVLPPLTK